MELQECTLELDVVLRAIANSLRSIMLTVASCKGENLGEATANSSEYLALMNQLSLLDYQKWPANFEDIPCFEEKEVKELS